jgi:hypothetical protein
MRWGRGSRDPFLTASARILARRALIRHAIDPILLPMAELMHLASTPWNSDAPVRIAELAERQWGVVTRAQLEDSGLGRAAISRWTQAQRLHRVHPAVYAVGHRGLSIEGRLAAALFYAGPGAALSHLTAAWWWQLLPRLPTVIHVSASRRLRSRGGVRLHLPRRVERTWHRRMAVTPVARTLLDITALVPFDQLRRAVAEAEYRRLIDLDSLPAVLGRGRPGSTALRAAITSHRPQLAYTLSVLEERFLALCEASGIAIPEVNVEVAGLKVDALWREARVIVELDGHAAHGTAAAIERDRSRELTLRAAGYVVLRYTWQQITAQPDLVVFDLRAALSGGPAERRPLRGC